MRSPLFQWTISIPLRFNATLLLQSDTQLRTGSLDWTNWELCSAVFRLTNFLRNSNIELSNWNFCSQYYYWNLKRNISSLNIHIHGILNDCFGDLTSVWWLEEILVCVHTEWCRWMARWCWCWSWGQFPLLSDHGATLYISYLEKKIVK